MNLAHKLATFVGVALLALTGTAQAQLVSPTDFTDLAGWETAAAGLSYDTAAGPSINSSPAIPAGTGDLVIDLTGLGDILGFSLDLTRLNESSSRVNTLTATGLVGSWTVTNGYFGLLGDGEIITQIIFANNSNSLDRFDIVNFNYATAVPVPAAVWLMGTALVGLFGIGRRKKTV